MHYRKFGQLDWEVSALGFGCMRLPLSDKNSAARIDEAEATRLLHYAIDQGVNYVDTAYYYHQEQSEPFVGRALKNGYRQKVKLATKLPSWAIHKPQDFDKYLNEQLARLQTDHIDFYLLHALKKEWWQSLNRVGVFDWAEKAIADGRIGHLGFSFHDKLDVFKEIVDGYDKWAFCQIQYNYLDINHQAGAEGLKYAANRGLAVVVMEPLLGGRLASAPAPIQAIWDKAAQKRSPAGWALQWLWDQPEVAVVLSGMSTMAQVEDNIAQAGLSAAGQFSPAEQALVDQVRQEYTRRSPIPCTACEYCLPCPNNVAIPQVFAAYNGGVMFESPDSARQNYTFISAAARADACVQCRECESLCPQNILISEWMPTVHAVLGEGQPYP